MPTYEYRCKDCNHQFEIIQSFADDALTECPECEGVLKKVFGNVGISFKGGGFYKTDSRTSGGSDTKTSTGSNSGSTGSSDAGTKSTDSSSASSTSGTSAAPATAPAGG